MPAPPDDASDTRGGGARPFAEAGALEVNRTDADAPGETLADDADPIGAGAAASAEAARGEDDDHPSDTENGAAAEENGAAEAADNPSTGPDAAAEFAGEAPEARDPGAARNAADPVDVAAEGEEAAEARAARAVAAEVASDAAGAPGPHAARIAVEPSAAAAAVEAGKHAGEALAADRDRAPAAGLAGEGTEARGPGLVRDAAGVATAEAEGQADEARGSGAIDDPDGAAAAPIKDAPAADASAAGRNAAPVVEGDAGEAPPPDPALFAHALRIAEALVFASDRPVTAARVQSALPPGCDARAVLTALAAACAGRPVQLAEVAGGFAFRTAPELAPAITRVVEAPRRLPRAAMETLAIVAYHQPVTRAEIEEIRGASLSQSTLEALLEMALIAPRGRKEVPGRPSLWGTTPRFLEQFGLKALNDLPRREELVNEPTLPLEAPPPAAPAP